MKILKFIATWILYSGKIKDYRKKLRELENERNKIKAAKVTDTHGMRDRADRLQDNTFKKNRLYIEFGKTILRAKND